MIITTTPTIEGKPIKEYKGIVLGDTIMKVELRDGYRFSEDERVLYSNNLREAQQWAINAMTEQAKALDANAIVGVDVDYTKLNSGSGVLMVNANGTAVVI